MRFAWLISQIGQLFVKQEYEHILSFNWNQVCFYRKLLADTHLCLLELGKNGHRSERAQAQAVIDVGPEVDDPQFEQLRRSIKILSTLLVLSVTLSFGLAVALAVWIVCKCTVPLFKTLCNVCKVALSIHPIFTLKSDQVGSRFPRSNADI